MADWNNLGATQGKISAQPHIIVKQICFPKWQCIVFVIVFSIQELNA